MDICLLETKRVVKENEIESRFGDECRLDFESSSYLKGNKFYEKDPETKN